MVAPTTVVLLAVSGAVLSLVWYYGAAERWRSLTEDRFLYGVPWGTLLAVTLVVGFYLTAQHGLTHWGEPLTLPFVSWSYFYPLGVLTSGFAHGSPAHLVGNMTGTLTFGIVAEYAYGHYPPARRAGHNLLAGERGWRTAPWVRALVIVPGAMFATALVTATFSFGPALGFSGAVFAIAGFAVVTRPLSAVVAVVASRALGTLFEALSNPVVTGTTSVGPPGPPSWASIAFQAHMLGFVLGAVLGVWLLWSRRERLASTRVFFGTVGFGLALSLWLVAFPGGEDTFVLYRGAGVVAVIVLTGLVTVAATGSTRPTPRAVGIGWLVLLALPAALVLLGLAAILTGLTPGVSATAGLVLSALLLAALLALALPAIPAALRGWVDEQFTTRRGTALLALVAIAGLLVLPGVVYSPIVVDDASVAESGAVRVGGYEVTYGEAVGDGRSFLLLDFGNESLSNNTVSGIVVANEQRQLWTVVEDDDVLAFNGNASVQVGGLGWRETVHAQRIGWDVTGNESAYVVDLTHDGETTRSFTSEPVRADVRIEGYGFAIVPTTDDFEVRVTRDGSTVGTTAIPASNETASVGPLTVLRERDDGTAELVVEFDGSRVTIAEKETYE